jgi:hypothetical protein
LKNATVVLGADIVTCDGNNEERFAAYAVAAEARGNGAVLDEYTAWTAAEMGVLDLLKSWFGTLITPSSTIASIDRVISREEESLGQESMSVAWRDGQFIRVEATDEFTRQQIEALQRPTLLHTAKSSTRWYRTRFWILQSILSNNSEAGC